MATQITETFCPKTRKQWREWLTRNHNKKDETWLVYFKKHTGKPTISYEDAIGEAICFGWVESRERSLDPERYTQRFIPRKEKSHWSESNIVRYKKLVARGLMTKAGKNAFKQSSS